MGLWNSAGPNGSGCAHQAYTDAEPNGLPDPATFAAFNELLLEIERMTFQTEEAISASRHYRACMKRPGFDVDDPTEVIAELETRWRKLTDTSLDPAVTDSAPDNLNVESIQTYERLQIFVVIQTGPRKSLTSLLRRSTIDDQIGSSDLLRGDFDVTADRTT